MKKQLVIVGIIVLLVCVGLSGCITYEDEEGTHLGLPPKHESNINEKPIIDILELESEILLNTQKYIPIVSPKYMMKIYSE